jgi:hypothetical protein
VLLLLESAGVLALLLIVPAALGTALGGTSMRIALRTTLGLAFAGQLFILLGTLGVLRMWSICAVATIALAMGIARMGTITMHWRLISASVFLTLPLLLLAAYPPVAFDETLYHLPFIEAIARSGAIRFLPMLRFPIFPILHEVLCVPAMLLAGDSATHLVALAEVLLLAGVLIQWPEQRTSGFLAAALLLGNPIVIQLATITYVDLGLTLFIAAAFYALDRHPRTAAFLLGTACSVKYLGWYFAAGAVVYQLLFAENRWRRIGRFSVAFLAGAAPMYGNIIALTGNPFFPFLPKWFGSSPWTLPASHLNPQTTHLTNGLRVFWDITFSRVRMNTQPPYSPLFAVSMMVLILFAIVTRNRRAAFLAILCGGYVAVFTFLPQDSRYLLPVLPLVSVAAVGAVVPLLRQRVVVVIALLAIAPGIAYAGYRFVRQGPLPLSTTARRQYQETHIPALRALGHRGPGRIYVCGAEQLKFFAGDELFGDVAGPTSYDTIIGRTRDAEELARTLSAIGVRELLASRAQCPKAWQRLPSKPLFTRIYADDAAQLWVVAPGARSPIRP